MHQIYAILERKENSMARHELLLRAESDVAFPVLAPSPHAELAALLLRYDLSRFLSLLMGASLVCGFQDEACEKALIRETS